MHQGGTVQVNGDMQSSRLKTCNQKNKGEYSTAVPKLRIWVGWLYFYDGLELCAVLYTVDNAVWNIVKQICFVFCMWRVAYLKVMYI
jgi:hypothetical protein